MSEIKLYESNNILYVPVARNIQGDMLNPNLRWQMYPIAVWDYVDPDYSDNQNWVQQVIPNTGMYPNEINEELQFVLEETAQDGFKEVGYTQISVSTIYYKDFYDESNGRAKKISVEDAVNNALDLL